MNTVRVHCSPHGISALEGKNTGPYLSEISEAGKAMSKQTIWGKILSGRFGAGGVAIGAVAALFLLSRNTSTAQTQSEPKLLIARGDSGLEWLVAEQLMRRFGDRGFVVDTVNVMKLRPKKGDLYDVIVVMGGVDRDQVTDRVLEQLSRKSHRSPGERTRILITTIHGELWTQGKTVIDAVSKATDDADAEKIAEKLAALVEEALRRNSDN